MMKPVKIVLTGAESTGKSTLSQSLANHYNGLWMPELAREYVQHIDHRYNYHDIEAIARGQIENERKLSAESGLVFFDTWLIITKVWFDFVYGKHPGWLHGEIAKSDVDIFLLCDIDLPWTPDPLRENGGENRKKLHDIYQSELLHYGFDFDIVKGEGKKRLDNAISIIENKINMIKKGTE
ncbi:MAG: ATP-binding protein [Prolixibacteraceae bacterium]|jgi:NadR type nicotinamide-nucleotide adenylyltransferase|nr:ATP-binding protein [Prolixibacteraceae bacterium]